MLSLIAVVAAIFALLGGSLWLFATAVSFLIVTLYPAILLAVAMVGAGLLAYWYYFKK